MGSACSTQNGTVVAASDQSVKAQLEEHVKVSSRTEFEEAKDNEEVKMEELPKPRQNDPVEQQTNEITDSKRNEKTERKYDESDDKTDKEKEAENDKDSEDDDTEEGQKKKQEPFTEEELRTFKEEKYKNLRSTADEVFALEPFQSEGGEYVKTIRNATVRFYNSYYALKRTNMAEIVKYRLECAKILIETRCIDLCCDIIIYTYTNGWYNEEGKKNELKFSPLNKCLVLLINFTDCSDELTTYLSGKKEFLDFLGNVLVDYRDRHFGKSEPQLKPTEERVLYSVISIVHNLSMRESIIETLREHGFVHTLQPFLDSSKPMYRLNALASLAGIINEEECEIINTNKNSVVFLLKVLGNCLADKRRRHRGWSAKESGLAVRTLARNDANKKLLAELGALELLVQLGKTGNTGEQYESVAAIWALCFDADNRVLVTAKEELGVVDLLLELKQGDDPEIKKVCNGALWTLREDLKNSSVEKYKKIGEQLIGQNEKHKAEILVAQNEARVTKGSCGHVMISYQWGNQEMLKTVRDRIKAYGYKVWMDIDQMGGSTLQAMADAVEGADVFLMCMSNRYKNSPACRAEAEYAFQTRKKIVPLKMEAGYNADGWLGFILGAKLFFDFSGKYPFEDKMAGLLKELDGAMKKVHGKEVKATQQQVSVVTAAPGPHDTRGPTKSSAAISTSKLPVVVETLSNVRNWSKEEVKKWIDANDLKVCGFEDMTGSEIAYLAKMQASAPEFFHKFLHDTLKAKTVSTIARIGWALHDLTAGQQSSS